MRLRIGLLGGTIHWSSIIGKATIVNIKLPLKPLML